MVEKRQPWMKWYPSDWRSEPRLRLVSRAARSLWMDMLGLMHEAEPYGELRLNGRALKPDGIAALLGDRVSDVKRWMIELEAAGVFSRKEDGAVFSRRMQRDRAKAAKDKENGGKGGNPTLKGEVNPQVKPEVKAQILDTRDQKPEEIDSLCEFDSFFAVFPKQEQIDNARKAYATALEGGATAAELLDGAKRLAAHVDREKIPLRFTPLAKTWLADGCWKDRYGQPEQEQVFQPIDPSWPADEVKRWTKNLGEVNFRTYFGPAEWIDAEPRILRYRSSTLRGLALGHFPKVAAEVALEVAAA